MRFWFWLLVFLGAQPAFAQYIRLYNKAGTVCLTWNLRSFVYHVDAAGSLKTPGDAEIPAIDAAFASWQQAANTCSDFQYIKGERLANVETNQGTPAENMIIWRERACEEVVPLDDSCRALKEDGSPKDENACLNKYKCWDHSRDILALTTTSYSPRTGTIFEGDVELNGAAWFFTTIASPPCAETPGPLCNSTDIQNTMTHEIGHLMGLAHVPDEGSTMAQSANVGDLDKRVLDPGTVLGLCRIYPRGAPPAQCEEGDGGIAHRRITGKQTGSPQPTGACRSNTGYADTAMLFLVSLSMRRRRQKPKEHVQKNSEA